MDVYTGAQGTTNAASVQKSIDGWGNPFERDPASVLDDVLNEKVSLECALEEYGVSIDNVNMKVNEEETMRLRKSA